VSRRAPRGANRALAIILISPREFIFHVCGREGCPNPNPGGRLYYVYRGEPCAFCGETVERFEPGAIPPAPTRNVSGERRA
jgi:hypothetical protein